MTSKGENKMNLYTVLLVKEDGAKFVAKDVEARTKEQAEQQQRLSQTSDPNTRQRYRGMEKSACVLCL